VSTGGATVLTAVVYNGPTILANFNPFSPNALVGTSGLVYEPLFGFNLLQGGKFMPSLVSSYGLSQDGTVLTLHVDTRGKWPGGAPVTSDDVAFNFSYRQANKLLGAKYTSIGTPNAHTVVVTYPTPVLTQLADIGAMPIVPKSIWQNLDPSQGTNPNPVGSGPFTVANAAPQQITFKVRSDYWRQTVAVKQFNATVTSPLLTQQMVRHEVDWTQGGIPNEQADFIAKDPTHNHLFPVVVGASGLSFNLSRKPFSDIHFRRGVSLAIDRALVAAAYNPGLLAPVSPTALYQADWKSWIPPDLQQPVAADRQAALSEFALAGYRSSGGKLVNSAGVQVAFSIVENSNFHLRQLWDKTVADQLNQIGMNVTVQTEPSGQLGIDLQQGNFDAVDDGWIYGPTPFKAYNDMLNSANIGHPTGAGPGGFGSNLERWKDPGTDALLSQLSVAVNPSDQQHIVRQLEQIVVQQLPVIPLTTFPEPCSYTTTRWVGWPDANNPFAMPSATRNAVSLLTTVLALKPAR
jgi:peptide/nickel transport system substrate-binding protein